MGERQASLYEIRWSASPITPYNFSSLIIANSPAPLPATTLRTPATQAWITKNALLRKTLDENTNASLLSNVVYDVMGRGATK